MKKWSTKLQEPITVKSHKIVFFTFIFLTCTYIPGYVLSIHLDMPVVDDKRTIKF